MKYIETFVLGMPVLELTRRNLETLLAKLDDPNSHRTLIDPGNKIAIRAVENEAHSESWEDAVAFIEKELGK